MIKRSVITGFLIGILFVLVAIYPMLSLYMGGPLRDPLAVEVLLEDQAPAAGETPPKDQVPANIQAERAASRPARVASLLLVVNGAAGLVVVLMIGSVAARRVGATDVVVGAKAGAISGLIVAVMFYALLFEPTVSLAASSELWQYRPTMAAPYPPDPVFLTFFNNVTRTMHTRLDLTLLIGVGIGAIEGAVVGWLRRHHSTPRTSLLDHLEGPQPRDTWTAGQDEAWRAGLTAGALGGGVLWLSITVTFLSQVKVDWPGLQSAVNDSSDLITRALFSDTLLGCLGPLFVLTVLGVGGLAVLLLKDPPRRHLSRFTAVMVAGLTASVFVLMATLQMVYAGLGTLRYLAWVAIQQNQLGIAAPEFVLDPATLAEVSSFVDAPMSIAPAFYAVPVLLFAFILISILIWLAPQAVIYGLTLPLIFRRPVDQAARVARAVNAEPQNLLPRIYGLYANDPNAIRILPHLSFLVRDQASARVVAAYYVLSTEPGETERAAAVIRQTLAEQEGWRWRAEVGELYRVLEEGLTAKTLSHVRAIQPPPQHVTSSLPPILARSCEGIGRVLDELNKVERVDDLHTKIIFLNSAQAALLDLRRQTEGHAELGGKCETTYPEVAVLLTLLSFWQGLILTATRDLQGRADLQASLLMRAAAFAPRVRQCIVVQNQGLNVAQNVRLRVAGGDGYRIVDGGEQTVDILAPQESRELEFWIVPDSPRRLRLVWELSYDDAVDTGRRVEFADAMELESGEDATGFQRIFPIPYVTGTPLRSGEMFVGRQDVFGFVREHLLGAYQNNVIVLHGQRRTGKTSILYRLQEVLADTHVAVLVDMQGKAARGIADFLYALSDDIAYTLECRDIFVDLPDRAEYEAAPEFAFRNRFLRAAVAALDHSRSQHFNLLLMFDEFEELQMRVEDGRLEPDIFSFLRNLMQHEPRADFLFCGTHKLEELGAEYWSILFNIAAYKRITFLDQVEVRRLVTEPVATFNMEYDPLAVDRIFQVTAGHPYFTQVVCHEMVAYHNEVERNYLTVTCVDQVLERIVERGEAHFKYIWSGATPDEQRVMLALTDLLPDPDSTVTPMQVGQELCRKGWEMDEESLTSALIHLQARDILTRSGPQSRLYRFKIDLIRRWIGITRPAI
ncbi:MAG: ATP-binding protein [Anaerolineae bacterium]|nr:ATP-binding protein [Anaerolineae bacterium]